MMPVNETCADSNIKVRYLPDLTNDIKMLFMLWSSGLWWHVVWYEGTNVWEKYATSILTVGCAFVPKTGHQTTHCHNPKDHDLNLHHTGNPKSRKRVRLFINIQFSTTLESHSAWFLQNNLYKWSTCKFCITVFLKKFTPGGTDAQILQSMWIPNAVPLKHPSKNAKVQFEHVFCMPYAMQFVYNLLRYFHHSRNHFGLYLWRWPAIQKYIYTDNNMKDMF